MLTRAVSDFEARLHADDTSDGLYGFVRGYTLTENLLRPALAEAGKILPRNVNATIDGLAARDGIIYSGNEGILAAPMQSKPPFEIIFETPHHAPVDLRVRALAVAVQTIFNEYRRLISFAANIRVVEPRKGKPQWRSARPGGMLDSC